MADMKVTVIPATKSVMENAELKSRKMHVAAYCRVSTDSEEQLNSYETQKAYYTQLIADNPNWDDAGIYADEGISGTDMRKRDAFNRMIAACKRGRIDMILTKSLSRFARNTVDCLDTIRMLKVRNIGVLFEKENINTLTESSEFLITLFSSFAQAESESLSKNVSWGIRKSMEAGNVPMHYATLLGYREGPDGNPEIVPEEAETVRQIYRWYIKGLSLAQIQKELEIREMKTARGSTKWSRNTVQSILTNEKYIGNAILQKTFTVDCISKKVRKNNGELPTILVENHHAPIISKTVFQWVQSEMKRRTSKRKVQQKTAKTEQGKYSGKYALTERLVCGECGTPYRRCSWNIRGKRKVVWRCISRLEFGKQYCHNSPTLEEAALHQAIVSAINQYAAQSSAETSALELMEMVVAGTDQSSRSIAQLQQEVLSITSEQERLLDLLLDDMDNLELAERMQFLTSQKEQLQAEIQQRHEEAVQQETQQLRMEEIRNWVHTHPSGLRAYDDQITRELIEKITVVDAHLIRIKFLEEPDEINQPIH